MLLGAAVVGGAIALSNWLNSEEEAKPMEKREEIVEDESRLFVTIEGKEGSKKLPDLDDIYLCIICLDNEKTHGKLMYFFYFIFRKLNRCAHHIICTYSDTHI